MNTELACLWALGAAIVLAFGVWVFYHACRWIGAKVATAIWGSGRPR